MDATHEKYFTDAVAGHARGQKFRGQHSQGVRRGCKGLKPQQHTQGPLLRRTA